MLDFPGAKFVADVLLEIATDNAHTWWWRGNGNCTGKDDWMIMGLKRLNLDKPPRRARSP